MKDNGEFTENDLDSAVGGVGTDAVIKNAYESLKSQVDMGVVSALTHDQKFVYQSILEKSARGDSLSDEEKEFVKLVEESDLVTKEDDERVIGEDETQEVAQTTTRRGLSGIGDKLRGIFGKTKEQEDKSK